MKKWKKELVETRTALVQNAEKMQNCAKVLETFEQLQDEDARCFVYLLRKQQEESVQEFKNLQRTLGSICEKISGSDFDSVHEKKKTAIHILGRREVYEKDICRQLKEKKITFGDIKFKSISSAGRLRYNIEGGKTTEETFDLYLVGEDSICIIEVDPPIYDKKDIAAFAKDLINRKITNFKIFFPQFANFKFYFALAIDRFGIEGTEEAVRAEDIKRTLSGLGVGLLTLSEFDYDVEIYYHRLKPF